MWWALAAVALAILATIAGVALLAAREHRKLVARTGELATEVRQLRDQQAASAAVQALAELETKLTQDIPEQRKPTPPEGVRRRKHLWIVPPTSAVVAFIAEAIRRHPIPTVVATASLAGVLVVGPEPFRLPVLEPPPVSEPPAMVPQIPVPFEPPEVVGPEPMEMRGTPLPPSTSGVPAPPMPTPAPSIMPSAPSVPPSPTPTLPPPTGPPLPEPSQPPELPELPNLPPRPELPDVADPPACLLEAALLEAVHLQACPSAP